MLVRLIKDFLPNANAAVTPTIPNPWYRQWDSAHVARPALTAVNIGFEVISSKNPFVPVEGAARADASLS